MPEPITGMCDAAAWLAGNRMALIRNGHPCEVIVPLKGAAGLAKSDWNQISAGD